MILNKQKSRTLLAIALPLTITISLAIFLQNSLINKPEVLKTWFESFGVYAIFIYIIIQSITIIIAPIGGFSVAIAIIAIFGPVMGNLIVYLVTTPLYIINFLVARKFGRKIVKKLVGNSGLKTVDKYSQKMRSSTLIQLKLFLGGYFDFISYAAGLTNISFKSFVIINCLVAIPNVILEILVFKFSPNFTSAVLISFAIPAICGIIYLLLHKQFKKLLKPENIISEEL